MILMVYTAFVDTQLGNNPPLSEKEKMIFMQRLEMRKEYFDTIPKIDTIIEASGVRYDTTEQINSIGSSSSSSHFDIDFQEKYFTDIEGIDNFSFYTTSSTYDVFINNGKLTIDATYADHRFFEVLNFKFIEGQPWSEQEHLNANPIIIITDELANAYFGKKNGLIGETVVLDDRSFTVSGVISRPGNNQDIISGDVYIPYTLMVKRKKEETYFGSFKAVYLATTKASKKKIKEDIDFKTTQIPFLAGDDFNEMEVTTYDYDELYALAFNDYKYYFNPSKGKKVMYLILGSIILVFSLVPILNLINLNVTRILERSSEIGVRKAFGADTRNILVQFLFENVIQTLIGAVLGLIMAILLIRYINASDALEGTRLVMNFKFFLYSFVIAIFFGILSGILPAWRMSKLDIAHAIKSTKL